MNDGYAALAILAHHRGRVVADQVCGASGEHDKQVAVHNLQGAVDNFAQTCFSAEHDVLFATVGAHNGVSARISRTLKSIEESHSAKELVGAAGAAVNDGNSALNGHYALLPAQCAELPWLFNGRAHSSAPRNVVDP